MNKKLYIIILLILAVSFCSTSKSFTESIRKSIEVLTNQINVTVNGEPVIVDNFLYGNTTYVPLRAVSEMLNKDISWDSLTNTADIRERKYSFKLHGYYAINSNEQFKNMSYNHTTNIFDSMSFGWAKAEYNTVAKEVIINNQYSDDNAFFLPNEYYNVVDLMSESLNNLQLNIYADKNLEEIVSDEYTIDKILNAMDINQYDHSFSFNGVVIDFEGITKEIKDDYIDLLEKLNAKLNEMNKSLYVAVPPPSNWSESYDYKRIFEIADFVILMAHDYEAKYLDLDYDTSNMIYTPVAPINSIKNEFELLKQQGITEFCKLYLQINFSTAQWKTVNNKLIDNDNNKDDNITYPSRPYYQSIYNRVMKEINKGKLLDEIIFYDEISKNPYIKYYNEQDNSDNIIWYEDIRSIEEKLKTAEEYGVYGISLWRIGNIPSYYSSEKIYLNVWQYLLNILD